MKNEITNSKYSEIIEDMKLQLNEYFNKYQDPIRNGLNVLNLPQHNYSEAWRSGN